MAILPLNHPTEHQESMFESAPAAEPEAQFETSFEQESENDLDNGFEEPTEFLEPDQLEVEQVTQDSVSFPDTTEVVAVSEPVIQAAQPASHDPFAAAARHEDTVPTADAEPAPSGVLTADDFGALEERVLRAVELVRRERQARQAAEQRTAILESQLLVLQAETAVADQLQQEVDSLRAEREQVRQRVERLLGQLDALEL